MDGWPDKLRRLMRAAAVVLAIPVLYALSVGPACRLLSGSDYTPPRGFYVFYGPLIRVAQASNMLDPLEDYVEWWYPDPLPPPHD